jgi:hypothetical protein
MSSSGATSTAAALTAVPLRASDLVEGRPAPRSAGTVEDGASAASGCSRRWRTMGPRSRGHEPPDLDVARTLRRAGRALERLAEKLAGQMWAGQRARQSVRPGCLAGARRAMMTMMRRSRPGRAAGSVVAMLVT